MLNEKFEKELRTLLPQLSLKINVPYREITSLGVGGTLPLLAEIADLETLKKLLAFCRRTRTGITLLGGGTNLVGMDEPCPLLGVRLDRTGFGKIAVSGNQVRCGAAVRLPELAQNCAEQGLDGLTALAGIPGSLGGAVRMNAGAGGSTISDHLICLHGIRFDGSEYQAVKANVEWGYRTSSLPEDVIVTELEFELPSGVPSEVKKAISAELEARRAREPRGRSAGCVFRNISELEPAGKLIDDCHLKGARLGDAVVSMEHANFILNCGNATEADFIRLMSGIRNAVAEKSGFYLRPEVKFINPVKPEFSPAPKVNVLYGGVSSEREISLRSGKAVATALTNAGFQVELSDLKECKVTPSMFRSDVVYPVLHGGFGEDGRLQKVLEKAGLRFVGSGSIASDLAMDKIATKKILDRLGLPTAKWAVVSKEHREVPAGLNFPIILKVPREGSTVGIIKVDSQEAWDEALAKELAMAGEILAEEYIKGVEITIPIAGGEVLPAVEIRSPHGFYDWDAKYVYKCGHTQYFCPAESLDRGTLARAGEVARRFYHGLGCRDILRVDFIVAPDGTPYVLEGNSLPGCTATSLVPKSAKVAGISFEKYTASQVYAAMRRTLPSSRREVKASPVLVALCRWAARLILLLCSLPFIWGGILLLGYRFSIGLSMMIFGLIVLGLEGFIHWLDRLGDGK